MIIIKGNEKNWGGKETAVSLPVEISVKIFNLLDGPSLLRSRLVARQWNICIEEFILGTEEEGRRMKMVEILQQQWGLAAPAMEVSQVELPGHGNCSVRALSRKSVALGDLNKLSVYNFSEVEPTLELELDGDFQDCFIDSSVLMADNVANNRVKVLNLSSGHVTYDIDSGDGPICYDKHQKSLIVGNERIKIGDDGTVSDVQQHVHLDNVMA